MDEIIKYLNTNKDAVSIILTSIAGLIALVSLIKAIYEYRLQGKQKRAELFDKFKTTLRTEKRITEITSLLEEDSIELKNIPLIDRYYFLGFYEQIAIATNSGLIKKKIAHYMFSYFAIACRNSENFWNGINKESYYWSVFNDFAIEMKTIEEKEINSSRKKLKY